MYISINTLDSFIHLLHQKNLKAKIDLSEREIGSLKSKIM